MISPEVEHDQPLKSQAARWVFSQGASTVLLCAILGFIGYAAMKVYPEIRADQKAERLQDRTDFTTALKEQRQEFLENNKGRDAGLSQAFDRLTKSFDTLSEKLDRQNGK